MIPSGPGLAARSPVEWPVCLYCGGSACSCAEQMASERWAALRGLRDTTQPCTSTVAADSWPSIVPAPVKPPQDTRPPGLSSRPKEMSHIGREKN